MNLDLSALPDYSALKKLAAALWQQENAYHGAAVMVGAGFSRSTASTGDASTKLPLWYDFSKILENELGSTGTDPLRLAEEYSAFFGKQALHDLIKKEINDAAWQPGDLHKHLLSLPWSEVLTTNWDTLLERASGEIQRVYSVVSKQEDLSSSRSPRIVKLHGTINISTDLVFTQEDYRKYPQHQAAFVNFARQVFIENELCLLGFSGDDPNFLQWAGWVRDHLSSHSRRIYLVGALNLNSAKRKYLESLNVAPIDLSDLVKDYDDSDLKHHEATKIFLNALNCLKPTPLWEWEPTRLIRSGMSNEEFHKINQDSTHAAKLLEEQIPILEADRKSYPGWLICPFRQRFTLQTQISNPNPTPNNLAAMKQELKVKLLYEIAWRQSITDSPTSEWLANEFLQICDISQPCILTKKQQLEIALLLVKNSQWLDKENAARIEAAAISILEQGVKYWDECSDEIAFHRAILARDRFNYQELEENVKAIKPHDSVWKLRKAYLHAELGQFEKGEQLVVEAYLELLKQFRQDKTSIYILSRLAWAHWLARGIDMMQVHEFQPYPSFYADMKCSPWDHIEYIKKKISDSLEKQRSRNIQPSFEPGSYKDNSKTVTFSAEVHPLVLFEGLSRTVGFPLRWKQMNFFADQAASLAQLDEVVGVHRYSLAIRSANSDSSEVFDGVFSRIHIACLSHDDVEMLFGQVKQAISYWSAETAVSSADERGFIMERLRVLIELLARLSVRINAEEAKQVFLLAISLGKNSLLRHFWQFKVLSRLLEFSLKSIPEGDQHEFLLEALSFPLPSEIGLDDKDQWPNPVIDHPGNRKKDTAIDYRIDQIINTMVDNSPKNVFALLRLIPLVKNKFLSSQELDKISIKIWGTNPDYKKIPETGLLNYVLMELPATDKAQVKKLVRRYLFKNSYECIFNHQILADIANAACARDINELPSEEQALIYFRKLVTWNKSEKEDVFGFTSNENRLTAEAIGKALSSSFVPKLPLSALNEENFQKLIELYRRLESPDCLPSFAYFAAAHEDFAGRVGKLIRQGFLAQDANTVAYSAHSLIKWRELKSSTLVEQLISKFIHHIEVITTVGLSALLTVAKDMFVKSYLSQSEIESLCEIVPAIFDDTDYKHILPNSRESVSVSLARASCVKLATALLEKNQTNKDELNRILQQAKSDPLPEVRFA